MIRFLESENEELRKANAKFLDTFYEDKSRAVKKLLDLEADNKNLQAELDSVKKLMVEKGGLVDNNAGEDRWSKRMLELESMNASDRELWVAENALLKNKLRNLEGTVSSNRLWSSSVDLNEIGELRTRCKKLSEQLSDKTAELYRLEARSKNQELLQLELNLAAAKVLQLTERTKLFSALEERVQKYELEQSQFQELFGSFKFSSSDETVSPAGVFRAFSDMQRNVVVLLGKQGELERKCTELNAEVERLRAVVRARDDEVAACKSYGDQCETQTALARNQAVVYEREVKSLREALILFDSEFKIGKSDLGTLNSQKDKIIDSLRLDLDEARVRLKHFMESNSTVSTLPKESSSLQLIDSLQRQIDTLKAAAGLDFVPGEVQVLPSFSLHTLCLTFALQP